MRCLGLYSGGCRVSCSALHSHHRITEKFFVRCLSGVFDNLPDDISVIAHIVFLIIFAPTRWNALMPSTIKQLVWLW